MILIGTQLNLSLFDVMTYNLCAPNGLEFSLEDDEQDFKDDFAEDETYDQPPVEGGFLKNLKSSERTAPPEGQKDFDEIDVDVDVDPDSEEEDNEEL
jgi:hypothetical protein